MKAPFIWDHASDQPYQIKDKGYKKKMRKQESFSFFMTFLSSLIFLPIAVLFQNFIARCKITTPTKGFFGLGIDLQKEDLETTRMLVEELNVSSLLLRFPLWEMERLDVYVKAVGLFKGKALLINVMQDREHVEDLDLLEKDLRTIFKTLGDDVTMFQIGSTVNRAKWGFFSVHEYLRFYQVAYTLKQEEFPNIRLLGSSVIDFEFHFTAHTLFNLFKIHYDATSALLYVDRRGAPENSQMGFALLDKIALLSSLVCLSPRSDDHIYITETNWPLSGTAPYAPTSEHECIDEEHYADYMVRYYLLAFASRQIEAVYWHQLIAPGYGLVDNRDGLRRRSAFDAFRTMIDEMADATFLTLAIKRERYTLSCDTPRGLQQIIWVTGAEQELRFDTDVLSVDRDGKERYANRFTIDGSPIYIYPEQTR